MYYEMFTLPWILMDTLWEYFDILTILQTQNSWMLILLALSTICGVASLLICIDCVRRLMATGQRSESALSMAEAFWVCGNTLWMLEDSLTHWRLMKIAAISLFALGPLWIIASLVLTNDDEAPVEVQESPLEEAVVVSVLDGVAQMAEEPVAIKKKSGLSQTMQLSCQGTALYEACYRSTKKRVGTHRKFHSDGVTTCH